MCVPCKSRPGEARDALAQALEDIICSMKKDEQCITSISVDESLAKSSLLRDSLPTAVLTYTVHLVSFQRGKDIWSLSDHECQQLAEQHKEVGTELFKAENMYGASLHYSKALKYILHIHHQSMDHGVERKVDISLKNTLFLNLAACQLKLSQFEKVVKSCSRVLEEDAGNVKALYRRGRALVCLNDHDNALTDFVHAKEVEPNNRAVDKQIRQLRLKVQEHNAKYRDTFKGMFMTD